MKSDLNIENPKNRFNYTKRKFSNANNLFNLKLYLIVIENSFLSKPNESYS